MKATLTFDLPEEISELLLAVHAGALSSALEELDQALRSHMKYGTELDVAALRREIAEALIFIR